MLDHFLRHPWLAVVLWPMACRPERAGRNEPGGRVHAAAQRRRLLSRPCEFPSASLEGAVEASTQIENAARTIPEVRLVYCKTGRPEIANDVMGVHQTDVWTLLKPQEEWRAGLTRDD